MLNTTVLNDLLSASHQNGFSVACLGVPIDNIHSYANYPAILDTEYCAYVYDLDRLGRTYQAKRQSDGIIQINKYPIGSGNTIADAYLLSATAPLPPSCAGRFLWSYSNYDNLKQEVEKNLEAHPLLVWAIHWQYHEEAPQHYDLGITDYTVEYDDDYLFVLADERKVFMLERLGLAYVGFRPMGMG